MRTHAWRPRLGRILLSLVGVGMAFTPSAHAATSELYDFNMGPYWSNYPSSFILTTNTGIWFKWVDPPAYWTEIASYNCATGGLYGSNTIGAGDTASKIGIGNPPVGYCFGVKGRTLTSNGYMFYYDGRIYR